MKTHSIQRLIAACVSSAGLKPLDKFKNAMESHLIMHHDLHGYLKSLPAEKICEICHSKACVVEKPENGENAK